MQPLAVDIGNSFNSPIGKTVGAGGLVGIILSNAVFISAVVLLFLLITGGIMIISGAGEDNPEKAARGKQAVTAALAGFIIIFASYWIIQLVELITGIEILNPGF